MSQAKDAGKRVTTAREAHDITATELSRRANVSRVTISAIEEGRALPRLETVESLAHALTVSPGWVGMLKVVLIDISHVLLRRGYNNIKNGLGNRLHSLLSIHGNMEELNCYHENLRIGLPPSRRVVSMFGYTFSNLANEIQFLQNALLGFERGDYFLIEVALHDLPLPLTENMIRESDPTLRGGLFQEFDPRSIEFFSGPLLRNRRGVREVKVSRTVQYPSVIPSSYAVGPVVTAYDNDGKQAEFRFAKANRYHLESLITTIEREGFTLIKSWRYGERLPCAVILFERKGRR